MIGQLFSVGKVIREGAITRLCQWWVGHEVKEYKGPQGLGTEPQSQTHDGSMNSHVDEHDRGINSARWLQRGPVLVAMSGDGRIVVWA